MTLDDVCTHCGDQLARHCTNTACTWLHCRTCQALHHHATEEHQ